MNDIASLPAVRRLIDLALEEDVAHGDVTTMATVAPTAYADAVIQAKQRGVIAGLGVAEAVFLRVDSSLGFVASVADGDVVEPGTRLAEVSGRAQSILTAERTALNFLQQLSGVATATRTMRLLIEGTRARLVDTRKTTPGLRALQKYAVRVGGGHNHRFHLADAVLIKDNHIAAAGGIGPAVRAARDLCPHTMRVEVEVQALTQLREALEAGADIIMLDNMDCATMRQAVEFTAGRALLEASGGIREETVAEVARTGVDLVSCGAITHSAPALDISLDLVPR